MLLLYQYLTYPLVWPARIILHVRSWLGKEIKSRINERYGISEIPKENGYLVWCHAASIGEVLTLLPLIKKFNENPLIKILITSTTVSSAKVISDQLNNTIIHQFAPLDHTPYVRRFLNHWKPSIALRVESELWPNTLKTAKNLKIPIILLNARLSQKSYNMWMRAPKTARRVVQYIDLIIAQSEVDAQRFKQLGAHVLKKTCNLKLASQPLQVDTDKIVSITSEINNRPIWFAASTHDGEEELAISAHISIAQKIPNLLTIIAPRHSHRSHKITKLAKQSGLQAKQRSVNAKIEASTDIYIVDTYGELGLFFSVSPIVFLGKSITKQGGQNPIEPAHFSCAILFGPHMQNFADIATLMQEHQMALTVVGKNDLVTVVSKLILSPNATNKLAKKALTIRDFGNDSIDITYSKINEFIIRDQIIPN